VFFRLGLIFFFLLLVVVVCVSVCSLRPTLLSFLLLFCEWEWFLIQAAERRGGRRERRREGREGSRCTCSFLCALLLHSYGGLVWLQEEEEEEEEEEGEEEGNIKCCN